MIRYVLYDPREGGGPVYKGMAIRTYNTPKGAKKAINQLYYVSDDVRQHLKVGVLDLSTIKEYTEDDSDRV